VPVESTQSLLAVRDLDRKMPRDKGVSPRGEVNKVDLLLLGAILLEVFSLLGGDVVVMANVVKVELLVEPILLIINDLRLGLWGNFFTKPGLSKTLPTSKKCSAAVIKAPDDDFASILTLN